MAETKLKPQALSFTPATLTGTETLTNKRNTKRSYSTTSTATLTPEIDTYDKFTLTAQAAKLTIANHSTSTPADGDMILLDLMCDGTARTLTFGTNYVGYSGITLPTTLVASKNTKMLFMWRASISKYDLVYLGQQT